MGVLNRASDGLPSVAMALVRALRRFGPLTRTDLLAVCCPATLECHNDGFKGGRKGSQTLTRWTQLGLFIEDADGRVSLHPDVEKLPPDGLDEVRALGSVLRSLMLAPSNNEQLNVPGELAPDLTLASDMTLALCWVLAQDIHALSGRTYPQIEPHELGQIASEPYPFRNATRWNGFSEWAPLIGFGWSDKSGLVIDPTVAVRDTLPEIFGKHEEVPIAAFLQRLADAIPVFEGGIYRSEVEARLETSWRKTRDHEISVSLSTALKRLDATGVISFKALADAPKRTLLGRGYRELEQVSHIVKGKTAYA
jgi:hypothetical protein